MAKVQLEIDDRHHVMGLPSVCMQCGAAATSRRTTTFYWHPQWIGYILLLSILAGLLFLPVALLLAVVLHKTQQVDVPLCDRHRHPWMAQRIVLLGGGLVLLLFVAVAGVAFVLAGSLNNPLGLVGIGLFAVSVFYLPVWLLTAAIIAQRSIHAGLITDREIKLIAVSRDFADAVLDAEDRPRRRGRYAERERRDDADDPDDRYSDRRNER